MKKLCIIVTLGLLFSGISFAQAPDLYLGVSMLNHGHTVDVGSNATINYSNLGLGLRLALAPNSRLSYYARADFSFIFSSVLAKLSASLDAYNYAFASEYVVGISFRASKTDSSRLIVGLGPSLAWDRLEAESGYSSTINLLTLGIAADLYYIIPLSPGLELFLNTGFGYHFYGIDTKYDISGSSFENAFSWSVSLGLTI